MLWRVCLLFCCVVVLIRYCSVEMSLCLFIVVLVCRVVVVLFC